MKKILLAGSLTTLLLLSSCQTKQTFDRGQSVQTEQGGGGDLTPNQANANNEAELNSDKENTDSLLVSNMASTASLEYVREVLLNYLSEKSVENFLKNVEDYNETVENHGLVGDFLLRKNPEYDIETLDKLWTEKKNEFIGTNCRLNTFTLLQNDLEFSEEKGDDWLLSFDLSAIDSLKFFQAEDVAKFTNFFSRVKTEKTEDVNIHAQKMKEHFSKFNFPANVEMISVVLHDTLDGDYLFVGHVGLLFKAGEQFLFLEKLSFQEPYQAIKFKSKEDCYLYLAKRYQNYGEGSSTKPFIMNNSDLVFSQKQNNKQINKLINKKIDKSDYLLIILRQI